MSKTILHRLRYTFDDTGDILDWIDTSDYNGKEMHAHISGMWDTMQAAARRIEKQERLLKIRDAYLVDHGLWEHFCKNIGVKK